MPSHRLKSLCLAATLILAPLCSIQVCLAEKVRSADPGLLIAAGIPPAGALVKRVPNNPRQRNSQSQNLPVKTPAAPAAITAPPAPPAPPARPASDPLAEFWSHMSRTYVSSSQFNTTDASEAEAMMKAAIDFAARTYGADSPEVGESIINLTKLYSMQARLGEMAPLLSRLAKIFSSLPPAEQNRLSLSYLDLACQLADNNRYRQAQTVANPILLASGQAKWADVDQISEKLARIGNRLSGNKRFAEAEPFFKASVALNEKRVSPDEKRLADERVALANVLLEQGKLGAADELYKMALSAHEKLYGADNGRLFADLIGIARLETRSGKTADAALLIPRIMKCADNSLQEQNRNTVHSLLELSATLSTNGNNLAARDLLLKAASLSAHEPQNYSSWEFQQALANLAENLTSAGKVEDAESLYLAYIKVFKDTKAASPEWTVSSLLCLAKFYLALNMRDKLEPVEQSLVAACQADPRNYNHRVRELANIYEQAGNVAGCERLYKALFAQPAITGDEKQSRAQDYIRLSQMYVRDQKFAEAEAAWLAVAAQMKQDLPPDKADLGSAFDELLKKLIAQKRYSETQSLMSNLVYSTYWRNRPDALGEAFGQIATMYFQIGEMERSDQLYKRALEITEKSAGAESHYTANILSQYAGLLRQMGRTKEAEAMDARSQKIREQLNHQSSSPQGQYF